MKKFIYPLLVISCFLFSSACYAYNVFTPGPADKSLEYLGHIFHIGNITGTSPGWMRGLFHKFNIIMSTLGVGLLSYIYIVSTINTAQEGTFMGKKFSAVYLPFRSFLGTALLIPTAGTGYSLIQQSVLWVVMNGVGAADNIWEFVVGNIDVGTGKVQLDATKPMEANVSKDLVASLLNTAVCIDACNKQLKMIVKSRILTQPKSYNNASKTAIYSGVVNFGIPGHDSLHNVCGSYKVTGKATLESQEYTQADVEAQANMLYQAKLEAIHDILGELSNIAYLITDGKVWPKDPHTQRLLTHSEFEIRGIAYFHPSGYINKAINRYNHHLSNRIIPKKNLNIRQIQHSAIARGWASAGEYYYLLNKNSTQELWPNAYDAPVAVANTVPSFDERWLEIETNLLVQNIQQQPSTSKLAGLFESNKRKDALIRTAYSLYDAQQYFNTDSQHAAVETLNFCTNPELGEHNCQELGIQQIKNLEIGTGENKIIIGDYIDEWTKDLFTNPEHKDPLLILATLGNKIMTEIENSWVDILDKIIKSVDETTTDEIKKSISETSVTVIVMGILTAVWGFAAALAVYLPAVPYMIFTLGVLGWMLLVVEATIAAPILAIGFIAPSQDEMGKTIPGIMLLLNILLRPSLMVIGFLVSSLFLRAALMLVNNGMMEAMYAFRASTTSVTGPIIMLFVYISFVIAITNKSFSLIYILPDKILRWVGSSGEDSGQAIAQVMGEAKGSYEKGSGSFGEFTKAITAAAGSEGTRIASKNRKLLEASAIPE